MRRIVVMNAKGGCGKTTVATNVASRYASHGVVTALFDYDPLGAGMRWVRIRPTSLPEVHSVSAFKRSRLNVTRSWQLRMPPGTECAVIDTPAGLDHQSLIEHVRTADSILVPVLPSPIDIATTADFVRDVLLVGKARTYRTRVGIVTNRVKTNTLAFKTLERFLATLDIPVVAHLRETQNYVAAAQQGVGIHELKGRRTEGDADSWARIAEWLESEPATKAATSGMGPGAESSRRNHGA
ncbi:MAG: AAA family ATPase [Gammaproteobacteria bacterium]|nr:AAA family ATPase [Gammaproteobacteria bacterium]NIR99076.1 AAA family ATPase [Gammaproteobacteria bacterium]NIX10628.1 AAA family ATPase [Gammaproteobacteria bacterium]